MEDAQGGMARRKAEQAAGILPQLPADGIRYCLGQESIVREYFKLHKAHRQF